MPRTKKKNLVVANAARISPDQWIEKMGPCLVADRLNLTAATREMAKATGVPVAACRRRLVVAIENESIVFAGIPWRGRERMPYSSVAYGCTSSQWARIIEFCRERRAEIAEAMKKLESPGQLLVRMAREHGVGRAVNERMIYEAMKMTPAE